MTHESHQHAEAPGGPEADDELPDADEVPVAEGPFDLPPVEAPAHWRR